MKVKIDIDALYLDRLVKKALIDDLYEYENYIEHTKRIKKLIKAYKLILKENYKFVDDLG